MTESTYTGTNFSHDIPFSKYEGLTNEEILQKYQDTTYESEVTGVCTYIVDGDTLDVEITHNNISETVRIRLVGINTPERNQNGYSTSKKFLEKICLNQELHLNIDDEKQTDKYGRTLALIIIDNKNLNEILVREGLAEVMYIPPTEFSSYEWADDEPEEKTLNTESIRLNSTIINQKKKLFLYVTQSKNLVWPNKTYDYQIYVKNISGQTIDNINIYITNPKEIVIKEAQKGENTEHQHTYKIPTLKSGQSALINVNDCLIMQEGYYNVNFIAMGDETEIKTQTLLIKCGYENDNKNILHRIAFYNFSPYESAYMQKASDFNENVTQLTKVQTKPFEAYNQPFEMDNLELDLYAQDIFLQNTDDISSMYLGRENWELNLQETFVGQGLSNLIHKINEESNLVDIDFLRVGNNEMLTDFQRIYPNGFIYRFGLIKSEFYKLLGIIPKIYSINDDLFRWARRDDEPYVYPPRENDKWDQKPWCGTGYYVYESKIVDDKREYIIEIAIFSTKEDAEIYVDNLETFNDLHFVDNIVYEIKKRDWLPGIFYVEIPLRDIPANFYIPSIDQIQAVIELTKPYGLKGYPRFALENSFIHTMNFSHTPRISPHIYIDLGRYMQINYHIRQKKYQTEDGNLVFKEYGQQADFISFDFLDNSFYSHNVKPSVYATLVQNIKYFTHDNKLYVHIYNIDDFNEMQSEKSLDIDVLSVSQDELIQILQNNQIAIEGLYFDYDIAEKEELIHANDFYNKIVKFQGDIFVVINTIDNSISTEYDTEYDVGCNMPNLDDAQKMELQEISMTHDIQCNPTEKSFDGRRFKNNSLDKLLVKNPEDISFYIEDDNQFVDKSPTDMPTITIPPQYKTLDYYNEDTSITLDIEQTNKMPSAFKFYKRILPQHINVNLILKNKEETTDFIISYKLLYDDVYQITYKTHKKTDVIRKEIVTQFDYILCEVDTLSSNKDLIKIYYALDNKIYFITSFTANIVHYNMYQLRVSLTNDLTLSSAFELSLTNNLYIGDMKYIQQNTENPKFKYDNWYLSNKQYSSIINTDNYKIKENPRSNFLWQNLYRINKDETSFALFENTTNEKTQINDIELFLDDINVPENSIIDKIYLDFYTDSREPVHVETAYQTNTNLLNENARQISSLFNIDSYEIYIKNNLRYLQKELAYFQEKENEKQIEYYQSLINTHTRQNQNVDIDFDKGSPLKICNNFWNEVRFKSTKGLRASDVKDVYLILEGYTHSDIEIESQLVYYDGIESPIKTNIGTGYFYQKIPINYNSQYNVEELSIRYKFNGVQTVELYNVKAEIIFSKKQDILKEFLNGENVTLDGLDKYTCMLCQSLDSDEIRNGLTIKLSFDEIQNYLKIYSIVCNVIYHEKAFTNIFEISPDFNTLSATSNEGLFRYNVFDEKISDMRQDTYTTIKPNGEYDAGFELKNRIYQAFIAEEDNITSIELKPNGRTGAPSRFLKIALLDNYENLPHNVLKEVIVDASQNQILDNEVYKYNICVNNLVPGNTYWFSIEPVDKEAQGARRFFYNNQQVGNFKLLSTQNGDVINQHASLYFRIYSKQNNYSFEKLPYRFDIVNDYTKEVNFITEIQIYNGYIQNFEASLFNMCICDLYQAYQNAEEDENVIEEDSS